MKTHVLMISRNFPTKHERKGEKTYFLEKIILSFNENLYNALRAETGRDIQPKLHTIRANYHFWCTIFEEIEAGEACLSLRYWSDRAYRSKQAELMRLTREDGIGLQKLEFEKDEFGRRSIMLNIIDGKYASAIQTIARNDGLSFDDFMEWFKDYDLNKPMAIIHFTPFRY